VIGTHIYAPGGIFKYALRPCRTIIARHSLPFWQEIGSADYFLVSGGVRDINCVRRFAGYARPGRGRLGAAQGWLSSSPGTARICDLGAGA
jgi:hypothetical protein